MKENNPVITPPETEREIFANEANIANENAQEESSAAESDMQNIELDLSSIKFDHTESSPDSDRPESEVGNEPVKTSGSPAALYKDTVSLIESGKITIDTGLLLLKKSGKSGYPQAYIYMGKMYSDESKEIYNPAIAFEYFSNAAALNFGDGHYYLGLCYNSGLGCERSPEKAYKEFLTGAEIGNDNCICSLGICREFGIGCDVDYLLAAEHYSHAAELGNVTAISNLGGCYLYGHGVPQNKKKAVELFKKGSELESAVAECRLGVCLEKGDGCERDEDAALACYEISASKGCAEALYHLALCYEKGVGTEQNFAQAFKYYNLSADAGCAEAMYESAMMSKIGKGTKKDPAAAYRMLSLAANAEFSKAEYELGNCLFEGIGTVKNRDAAFKRYTRAYEFDKSNAEAAYKLGLCSLKGLGTSKDEAKAFDWFCRGTELGSPTAAYMKGECFFFGVGISQERSVAASCFEKSIELANGSDEAISAILSLAQSLNYGYDIPIDTEQALKLYKQASDKGNAEAIYHMGLAAMINPSKKDEQASRALILRSARMEFIPAMLTMGIFAEEGKGAPANTGDAKKWYERVVDAEPPKSPGLYDFPSRFYDDKILIAEAKTEAQYRLGMLTAAEQLSMQECVKAFEHIAMAASLGHAEAQIEVTRFHMHGGDLRHYYDSPTFVKNIKYTPDKEKLGSAMNRLGDSYFDGKTLVNKNLTAAARCYKIAAEFGNIDGCYSYGWCLRHGSGINENDSESLKWLKLAADKGNVNAAFSYGLCCEEGAGTGIKNLREARSYYRKAAVAGHVEAGKRYMKLSSDQ